MGTIHTAIKLSGRTRDWIAQLISRYAVPLHGHSDKGGRDWLRCDLFNITLAGVLYRLNFTPTAIRDVIGSLGLYKCGQDGLPVEIFPGSGRGPVTEPLFLLIYTHKKLDVPVARLCTPDKIASTIAAYDADGAIVVDATAIARRVDAALAEEDQE